MQLCINQGFGQWHNYRIRFSCLLTHHYLVEVVTSAHMASSIALATCCSPGNNGSFSSLTQLATHSLKKVNNEQPVLPMTSAESAVLFGEVGLDPVQNSTKQQQACETPDW